MANHVRQQLTVATKTRVTSLTTTGARVFGYRVNELQPAELPALCVYTLSDVAEPLMIHSPILYERSVDLHIVGYAARNTTLDSTLDLIGKEVEAALATALTLAGKTVEVVYQGCVKTLDAGETQAGSIDMLFKAPLANLATTPDVLS